MTRCRRADSGSASRSRPVLTLLFANGCLFIYFVMYQNPVIWALPSPHLPPLRLDTKSQLCPIGIVDAVNAL